MPLCQYLWHKHSYGAELHGTDLPTVWNQVLVICYPDLVFGFFVDRRYLTVETIMMVWTYTAI